MPRGDDIYSPWTELRSSPVLPAQIVSPIASQFCGSCPVARQSRCPIRRQPMPTQSGSAKPLVEVCQTPRATVESDRKSTRLNSSHTVISYAVFCLKKKKKKKQQQSNILDKQ